MNSETNLLTLWYLYDSNSCALKEKKNVTIEETKIEISWSCFTWIKGISFKTLM